MFNLAWGMGRALDLNSINANYVKKVVFSAGSYRGW
jgi:hypothetical protein